MKPITIRFRALFSGALFFGALFFGWICSAAAQEPTGTPPANPSPPPPPVLEYTGKPITLPFHCADSDIQWAGLTCSAEEPCPIYLELTTVEAAGERILVAGNLHSAAVTLYSALLGSQDGGHTWTEPMMRIRGAVLDRVQFLNSEMGWVSGHSDFPLPGDPFLLATTDGGKTWQSRPIFQESAENRLGMIQQFFFTAPGDGSLVVDRGQGSADDRWELYESQDAGASWQIRQTSSKPIRLKQTYSPNPGWRLRADGPSKSFHIERREESRWKTAAAFAVNAGVCRPEP